MQIKGKVLEGKKRGKTLGFPTANVRLDINASQGIYISQTEFEDKVFESVTFIGNAKTFGEKEIFAETYILNFDRDIYNKEIVVHLLKKIRENEKFETVDSLITQIKKDVEETENYFKDPSLRAKALWAGARNSG